MAKALSHLKKRFALSAASCWAFVSWVLCSRGPGSDRWGQSLLPWCHVSVCFKELFPITKSSTSVMFFKKLREGDNVKKSDFQCWIFVMVSDSCNMEVAIVQ